MLTSKLRATNCAPLVQIRLTPRRMAIARRAAAAVSPREARPDPRRRWAPRVRAFRAGCQVQANRGASRTAPTRSTPRRATVATTWPTRGRGSSSAASRPESRTGCAVRGTAARRRRRRRRLPRLIQPPPWWPPVSRKSRSRLCSLTPRSRPVVRWWWWWSWLFCALRFLGLVSRLVLPLLFFIYCFPLPSLLSLLAFPCLAVRA